MPTHSRFDTHEVFNQSPPYENVDLFTSDTPLVEAIAENGASANAAELSAFGRQWGTADMFALGGSANENPPKLATFDAKGVRRDTVEFHPSYHRFMTQSVAEGLHSSTWTNAGRVPLRLRKFCGRRGFTWPGRSKPDTCVRSR
jgi:putative acyl-CoA dehydrogenase